mgnify:CR=1 FL=1
MKGVVVKSTGSWYEVRQEDGSVIVRPAKRPEPEVATFY